MDELLPLMTTAIINRSMGESVMPLYSKGVTLTLVLKRSVLHKEDVKNYRPTSNFSVFSKLIKKVVPNHIQDSNIRNCYQFAYRRGNSTEAALLKLHRYINYA